MGSNQCELAVAILHYRRPLKLTRQIVGAAVDGVLYEPGLSKDVSYKRAKAILTIGGIFKTMQPDEGDDERRELER